MSQKCENRGVNLGENDCKCYICKPKTQGCTDMEENKGFNMFPPDLLLTLYILVTCLQRAKFVQIHFFVQLEILVVND